MNYHRERFRKLNPKAIWGLVKCYQFSSFVFIWKWDYDREHKIIVCCKWVSHSWHCIKNLVWGRMSNTQLLHGRSMDAFFLLRSFFCLSTLSVSWYRETSSSTSTVVLETSLPGHLPPRASVVRRGSSHTRWPDTISSVSIPFTRPTSVASAEKPRPHYFKFQLFPGKALKIKFDRLALLALMDRWDCTKSYSQTSAF